MKSTRYMEEQIVIMLRQAESGAPVAEVIRKMGITEITFYRLKNQFAGMGVAENPPPQAARGRERSAQETCGDLTLDKTMLQDVLKRNW